MIQDNALTTDLTININCLDAEWLTLPSLYFKYREESDYLDIRLRKAKMKLDFESAKLDSQIRSDPKNYFNIEKPTETQIRCFIQSSDMAFEIENEIIELERKKKVLASAIASLEMKRDALKNLTQLLNGEYFTTRRVDKDVLQHMEKNQDIEKRNIRREMRVRMNKTTKEE